MHIIKDVAGLILFSLLLIVNQWYFIPIHVIDEGSSELYPYFLNGLLALFLAFYLYETIRIWRKDKSQLSVWYIEFSQLSKIIILLASIWIWNTGLEHFGFIIPTALFLSFSSWLYGERKIRTILLVGIVTPLFLIVSFTLIGSILPQGPLENSITILLSN